MDVRLVARLRRRVDHLVQHLAGGVQTGDQPVDARPFGGEFFDQPRGGGLGGTAVGVAQARQQARDLPAVQARGEQLLDPDDAVDRPLRVVAVPAGRAIGRQQPLLLVVPQ
ncbi:hypothetical protein GCM10017566_65360 [Amycolatopsis bartoniae]|uniref:Uncharacterized protein n=1 Tax=Amycolatopsis bartoniae TaxID=941986 RepID=A0A8H9J6I3_9PSEU|nr:hypothetical protein GCM10017566_65360 [Amycolatopsis bartoniae]